MSAVDQHAEAHRLKAELGYGARRIGEELGISRYAAEQLLKRPPAQPPEQRADEPVAEVAESVAEPAGRVAEQVAGARLPIRRAADRLDMDLGRWPGLRRDLALLAQTGATPEDLVATAVRVLAVGYRQGLAAGDVQPGRPFSVTRLSVAALALPGPRVPAVAVRSAPPEGA